MFTPRDPYHTVERELAAELREPRWFPWMVILLVGLNGLCWLIQLSEGESFTNALAETPYEVTHNTDLVGIRWLGQGSDLVSIEHAQGPKPIYLTLFTAMFLHGSWVHLLGNMLYLSVFGAPIERRTGPWRFLGFYLVCGVVGGLAYDLSVPESIIPSLGASGAISGILGAYVLTFPLRDVPTVVRWLTTGVGTGPLPAVVVFGGWLLSQWMAYWATDPGQAGGVAAMAHIGGFLAGLLLAAFLVPNQKPPSPRRHGWVSH